MTTYHGKDGWSIEDENLLSCWIGNNYVTKHIDEDDIPGMVDALVTNCDVELTEDAITKLDGSSYDDLMSLMLACAIVLGRMNRQVDEQGATDEEMLEIMDTAIDLRSTMLGITKDEARNEMMNDDLIFDASIKAAKKALGYKEEPVLNYEDRFNPDKNVTWYTKDNSMLFIFRHGQWVCDTYEKMYTMHESNFAGLDKNLFPMRGEGK